MKRSKRYREIAEKNDLEKIYSLEEAIAILKKCPPVKFDQSVEVSLKTGIDAKKSDQQVRGTVTLPHGSGKTIIIAVFAKGDKIKEALDAGADFAGHDELVEKVKGGWTGFDAVIATPDMMREVGKLGKVLGPRGLMPTPKAGTVTPNVGAAVKDVKAGKIEFKSDKHGSINAMIGKLSFDDKKLLDNMKAYFSAILRAKPASAKGSLFQSCVVSSTMGPGIKVDVHGLTEG